MSSSTPERFTLAIVTQDENALPAAQGVGKKLAQRIILELKDKLAKEQGSLPTGGGVVMTPKAAAAGAVDAVSEAVSALVVLGYSQAEALQAMEGIQTDGAVTSEQLIRTCLKKLAAQ